jgi:hypothetical protein
MDAARIRIEAPDELTARRLMTEAKGLVEAEVAMRPDGRWEVQMTETRDTRLSTASALNAVQRWLADCGLSRTTLHLDGEAFVIVAGEWIPRTREEDLALHAT